MNPLISVNHLHKRYRGSDVDAVAGISFDVAEGEVFGLLGPNGAGKSTTIGMLTTTIIPTGGRATVAGSDVSTDPIGARNASAVVFQDPSLDRGLTGRRNLAIHARLWGLDPRAAAERIDSLVESFGLADFIDRPAEACSGGQRRRIEIARALVSEPAVLFLDEPTVGLDPRIRFELLDVIGGLRARGEATIVLTTHYLDEAERLCDRVGVMHGGRLVAVDTPARFLAALGREIVDVRVPGDAARTLATLQRQRIAGDDAFAVGATISIPLHDRTSAETLAWLAAAQVEATSVAARPPTLDDVYLRLTGEQLAA
jgi:ABC-2 type transport system ATP-binding protein